VTEGVGIGTAIVSYIEPHVGAEREFNRWYERDHFPAAVMAGPGAYAGARFVATRQCKETRLDGRLFGDPHIGSYLSVAWLLPNAQTPWDTWIALQMDALRAEGRMFAGRDHLHTAVYEAGWDMRAADAPPASLALDHGYPGVIAVAVEGQGEEVELEVVSLTWDLVGSELPLVVALRRERLLASTLGEPPPHFLVLAFVDGDVIDVWDLVAPAIASRTRVGFAGPFLATVPGTDTYDDVL
jgi:hypothetical protein